jgi:hypothetical protein
VLNKLSEYLIMETGIYDFSLAQHAVQLKSGSDLQSTPER